jgi:hypothetical protein
LEIQAKIAKRRIELQAGPLEAMFEKHFGWFYFTKLNK